jgi:cell division protein FtsL
MNKKNHNSKIRDKVKNDTVQSVSIKFMKSEMFLYFVLVVLILLMPITSVFLQSSISSSEIEIEKIEKKIDAQKKANQALSMQINELASLDNIQKIAEEYGLSYKYGNIITIDGDQNEN